MIKIFFDNLRDDDFERLCADILEYKLKEKFRCYKKGPDQGIDIESVHRDHNIIGQAKNWENTSVSKLKTSLKNCELPKVISLHPKRYVLFISKELTRKQIKEIVDIFSPYLKEEDVYDGTIIKDILNEKDAEYILDRWEQIWLSPSTLEKVYHKFNVSQYHYLKNEILEESTLFVETYPYQKAKKILNKENVILIHGEPGVGKTTIAKALTITYLEKDYQFIYGNASDLKEIERKICNEDKQLILIDDFLGSNYLEKNDNVIDKALDHIISSVKKSNHKKLILTTRTYIYNNAREIFEKFYFCSENMDKILVNVKDYTYKNKGEILHHHLKYHNLLWTDQYLTLISDQFYQNIIWHRNFNPRLISLICTRLNKLNIGDVQSYIKAMLDNPSDIWMMEYQKLTKNEKLFLNMLSLFSYQQDEKTIFDEFHKILSSNNITIEEEEISSIIKSLSIEFITITFNNNERYFSISNHSIVDFIIQKFVKNEINIETYLNDNSHFNLLYQSYLAFYSHPDICKKIVTFVDHNLKHIIQHKDEFDVYVYNVIFNILSYDLTEERQEKLKKILRIAYLTNDEYSTHFLLMLISHHTFLSTDALAYLEDKILNQRDCNIWFYLDNLDDLDLLLHICLEYANKKNEPFMLAIMQPLIDALITIVSDNVSGNMEIIADRLKYDLENGRSIDEISEHLAKDFFEEELAILKKLYTKKYYDEIYSSVIWNLETYVDEDMMFLDEDIDEDPLEEDNTIDHHFIKALFEEDKASDNNIYYNIPSHLFMYLNKNILNEDFKNKLFTMMNIPGNYLIAILNKTEIICDLIDYFNEVNIIFENEIDFYLSYLHYKCKTLNQYEIDTIYDIAYSTFCNGQDYFETMELPITLINKLLKLGLIKNKDTIDDYQFVIKEIHIFLALQTVYKNFNNDQKIGRYGNILELLFCEKFDDFYGSSGTSNKMNILRLYAKLDIQGFNTYYISTALNYILEQVNEKDNYIDIFIQSKIPYIELIDYDMCIMSQISLDDLILEYLSLSPTDVLRELAYNKHRKLLNKIKDEEDTITLSRIYQEPDVRVYFEKLGLFTKLENIYCNIKKALDLIDKNPNIDLYQYFSNQGK